MYAEADGCKKIRGILALTDISSRRISCSFSFPFRSRLAEISRMPIVRCNRAMHVSAEPETGRERGRLSSFSIVRYNTRIRARLRGRIFSGTLREWMNRAGTDRRPRIFDDYRSVCIGQRVDRRRVPVWVNEVTTGHEPFERPSFYISHKYKWNELFHADRLVPPRQVWKRFLDQDRQSYGTNLLIGFIWTRYKKLRNAYLCV